MTRDEAITSAVRSMLDVVEEIAVALANGDKVEPEWVAVVQSSFAEHRQELLEAEG